MTELACWHIQQTGARRSSTLAKGEEELKLHNVDCLKCQTKNALTANNCCTVDLLNFAPFWNEAVHNQDAWKKQCNVCCKINRHLKIHCHKREGDQSATMLGIVDRNNELKRCLRNAEHLNDAEIPELVSRQNTGTGISAEANPLQEEDGNDDSDGDMMVLANDDCGEDEDEASTDEKGEEELQQEQREKEATGGTESAGDIVLLMTGKFAMNTQSRISTCFWDWKTRERVVRGIVGTVIS